MPAFPSTIEAFKHPSNSSANLLDNPLLACDDDAMTNYQTPAADIAATMMRAAFTDLAPDLDNYLTSTPTDDPTRDLRERLISALDFDIADMLHNANLDDLIPDAALLSDDDRDELTDRLLDNDDYICILADMILADLP